jgi:hypothetical protein
LWNFVFLRRQKRKALTGKSVKKPQANDNLAHVWSGKVHRLCALWSAEVLSFCLAFSDISLIFQVTKVHSLLGVILIASTFTNAKQVYQNDEEPWVMMELEAAMRRSRKFVRCFFHSNQYPWLFVVYQAF